jgi:DnaJ-class molecular chaperone
MYTINNNIGNIIAPNHKKIISNMGLTRDNHTGSLVIQFEVQFPEKLSEEAIKQLLEIL